MDPADASRQRVDTRLLAEDADDLYENAPCGYLSTLPDGLIARVNDTFLRWTGHERAALVGVKRFPDLLTVGGRIFHETHFAPLLRMQGAVREIALDLICGDGNRLPVLVNAVLRTDDAGQPAVVRIMLFDATDRRRYERELLLARNKAQQAAQARTNLVSMISHDIRAPLSAILTATALLEKTAPSERQQRYLRVLRSACDQAMTLVNSVLDLSRLDAGRTILRDRPFDVAGLVQEVVGRLRLVAEQKPALAMNVSVDERVPAELVGDPDKIGQVLTNLISNAIKFTERGFVTVSVSTREVTDTAATLEVLVSDSGIGIPADRLPHILEEFTQADPDTGEKYGGSGLGLAISRRLLQLYGAGLEITSAVGQGTTVSFTLQLKRVLPPPHHP